MSPSKLPPPEAANLSFARREPAGPEEAGLRVLEEPRPGRTLSSVQTGLRAGRACAVDEAYDEYCKLLEAGARPDPDRFCERFPHCKTSLQRVLQLHCFIEGRPELLADSDLENAPEAGQEFLHGARPADVARDYRQRRQEWVAVQATLNDFRQFWGAVGLPLVELYGYTESFTVYQQLIAEWGVCIIIAKAFTPVPFKIAAIAAGIAAMDPMTFMVATVVGRALHFAMVGAVLALFGPRIVALAQRYERPLIIVTILVLIGLVVAYHLR